MKTETPAEYATKMERLARRGKPTVKKGKSRKDPGAIHKESNAALVAKLHALEGSYLCLADELHTLQQAHVRLTGESNYRREVMERALERAAGSVRMLPMQEYVDRAEAEIKEEIEKHD